jgi:hypothetical protein
MAQVVEHKTPSSNPAPQNKTLKMLNFVNNQEKAN